MLLSINLLAYQPLAYKCKTQRNTFDLSLTCIVVVASKWTLSQLANHRHWYSLDTDALLPMMRITNEKRHAIARISSSTAAVVLTRANKHALINIIFLLIAHVIIITPRMLKKSININCRFICSSFLHAACAQTIYTKQMSMTCCGAAHTPLVSINSCYPHRGALRHHSSYI